MEADFREAVGLQLPSLSLVLYGPYTVPHCFGIEGAGLRLPLVLGEQRRVFLGGDVSAWCEHGREGKYSEPLAHALFLHHLNYSIASKSVFLAPN